MNKPEYQRMAEKERTYWWHLGRLKIIKTYIELANKTDKKISILNVGCGTGGTIDLLESFGKVVNVDNSDDAIKFMKSSGYKNVTKVEGIGLPFANSSFDIVGAFDVLEHIDDDRGALAEWSRVLNPGGAVVLTVPAYQWLWSGHDEALYHKRRYTRRLIASTARDAGLVVERSSYAVVFSLPLVIGFRLLNHIRRKAVNSETSYVAVPNWTNGLFTRFLGLESKLHQKIIFPAGTTVVAILRKKS